MAAGTETQHGHAPIPVEGAARRSRYAALWWLRRYAGPWRWQVIVMFIAAFLGVAASTAVPLVIAAIVDGPIKRGERGELIPLFVLVLFLGVAEATLIWLRRWIQSTAVLSIERDIRNDFYSHLQRLSVAFHDKWGTGQLLSRATTDLSTIRRFFGFGAIYLVINIVQYIAVLILLIATYWSIGLLVAAATIPVVILSRAFGAGYAQVSREMQDRSGDLATLAEEAASGIRVTKAFGRGPWLTSRFLDQATRVRESQLGMVRLLGRFWSLLQLIPNLTMAVVVLLGSLAVAHGSMSLGDLVAFVTLLVLLQWPVIDIGWILAMAEEAATAATRILEVFDTEPAITDPPHPVPLVKVRGRLSFEHVAFQFDDADEPTLSDVTLDIAPGETVAIVGATGSGKSVMTALPSRLYDVTGGRITLDGIDIRDLSLSSLRREVATAFEDPVLFSMSVRENLVLGRPDATDDEVQAALDLAQADFVLDLPWGLDTRIGEQGLSLSGGQRQRLALARAVVAQPSVLVLDDPLSALDVHTEALVERALSAVLGDTTGLLVVHRPSTVALADRVALLADGRLVAVGTHSELMGLPAYAEILSVDDTRATTS
ncbi:MAG TPA: ABC transporter ATP-binding protein [Mycobacteriales bacterium]|jgi:ATP-binding cassette subfamily B protein|nr:ABC transporter ATP-binding protein [Mycobacteriales bacterium]